MLTPNDLLAERQLVTAAVGKARVEDCAPLFLDALQGFFEREDAVFLVRSSSSARYQVARLIPSAIIQACVSNGNRFDSAA
jgi:hypothetical protein